MIDKRVKFKESPSCEHCGNLEQFDAIFDDAGCHWCIACIENGGSEDKTFNEEELKEIKVKELTKKIVYFIKQVQVCGKELEKLI